MSHIAIIYIVYDVIKDPVVPWPILEWFKPDILYLKGSVIKNFLSSYDLSRASYQNRPTKLF